ncbi:MAG TPA: 6-phosphogluconolactonase [Candidatus Saccharibacteria bacterium]|nr:6-phosphogluconolactonase [Candidatus Saccharibacteria bacterium]
MRSKDAVKLNFNAPEDVAKAAAKYAVNILSEAVAAKGRAVWVLAGGTSPMAAYKIITQQYADSIDWTKVIVLIGDERFVPFESEDSNWGTIMEIFDTTALGNAQKIAPYIKKDVAETAQSYQQAIIGAQAAQFDLVWLGVGEDGHTLSMFPGNRAFIEHTEEIVVPVYDSPKPPAQRISLSLHALKNTQHLEIFAVGGAKKDALLKVRMGESLPIGVAAQAVDDAGGVVRWLYDEAAWGPR